MLGKFGRHQFRAIHQLFIAAMPVWSGGDGTRYEMVNRDSNASNTAVEQPSSQPSSNAIQWVALWTCLALLGIALFPIAEFAIRSSLRLVGLSDVRQAWLDSLSSSLFIVSRATWFPWVAGASLGFLTGVCFWRERAARGFPKTSSEDELNRISRRIMVHFQMPLGTYMNEHYIQELRGVAHHFSDERNTINSFNALQYFLNHISGSLSAREQPTCNAQRSRELAIKISSALAEQSHSPPKKRDAAMARILIEAEVVLPVTLRGAE